MMGSCSAADISRGLSVLIAQWTLTDRGPGPSHRHGFNSLADSWLRARGSVVSIFPNVATERGIHACLIQSLSVLDAFL